MAIHANSTPAPAVHRPGLLPFGFRALPPIDDPRSAVETLDEIREELGRYERGERPDDPLLPAPAPLPSLPSAFSRRAALFGPVRAAGLPETIKVVSTTLLGSEAEAPLSRAMIEDVATSSSTADVVETTSSPAAGAPQSGAPIAFTPDEGDSAAAARALHARRALEQALDHGTALLAALGLPRLVDDGFVHVDTEAAGEALDQAVALLDALDPDPDLEPSLGAPEMLVGSPMRIMGQWMANPGDQRHWADGSSSDREDDIADEPHDDEGEAETTANETGGRGFFLCGPDDAEDDDPGWIDDSGIADSDGYHEQCGYAIAGALPWSVGGYVG